jgi:hypothetical protein
MGILQILIIFLKKLGSEEVLRVNFTLKSISIVKIINRVAYGDKNESYATPTLMLPC